MEPREKQTTYPEEFKKSAVKLALESDQSIVQTARDLGINKSTLYTWIGKNQNKRPQKSSKEHDPYEEIKRLRKENKLLKEEREILKKAATYFAKIAP
jgi:transposase